MIIEVKANTWYRLLDKDAYFKNDLENEEIYSELFNIHGCVKSDTVMWGSLITKSYFENPSDPTAYEIIAPNEYHLFEEVSDGYGNSTEQAEASESDSKPVKEDIDTITLTGEKGSVYKSRGTPEAIIKGADTVLGITKDKPVYDVVTYTKEMFDEGILPEVGMVHNGELITEVYFRQLTDGTHPQVLVGFEDSGLFCLSCLSFEKTFEQKVVDKIKLFWKNTFGEFDEHNILDVYQTFKNIEKEINGE